MRFLYHVNYSSSEKRHKWRILSSNILIQIFLPKSIYLCNGWTEFRSRGAQPRHPCPSAGTKAPRPLASWIHIASETRWPYPVEIAIAKRNRSCVKRQTKVDLKIDNSSSLIHYVTWKAWLLSLNLPELLFIWISCNVPDVSNNCLECSLHFCIIVLQKL